MQEKLPKMIKICMVKYLSWKIHIEEKLHRMIKNCKIMYYYVVYCYVVHF